MAHDVASRTLRKTAGSGAQSLPEALLDLAQTLFGDQGIEGVSLRQIGAAAGSANTNAVQYHYGDKVGLLKAICTRGSAQAEADRAALLCRLERLERFENRDLVELLYRPLLDHRDKLGGLSYQKFLLALISSPFAPELAARSFGFSSLTVFALQGLHEANPEIPFLVFMERQRLVATMVLTSLFHRNEPLSRGPFAKALTEDILDMATSALVVPVNSAALRSLDEEITVNEAITRARRAYGLTES